MLELTQLRAVIQAVKQSGGEMKMAEQSKIYPDMEKALDEASEEGGDKHPTWDPKDGEQVMGEVIQLRRDIHTEYGPNDLIAVKPEDGEAVAVWNSKVLKPLFENIAVGKLVGIKYLGMKQGKAGMYKDYKFVVREGPK